LGVEVIFERNASIFGYVALVLMTNNWLAAASPFSPEQETNLNQSRAVLEFIGYCDGMCGTLGNKTSLKVDYRNRAEYKVSTAPHPFRAVDEAIISTIDVAVDGKELAELIKLTGTTEFLTADATYDSGTNLVDAVYLTFIIYRDSNREKLVMLRNHFTASKPVLPAPIRRLLEIATELRAKAKKQVPAAPK